MKQVVYSAFDIGTLYTGLIFLLNACDYTSTVDFVTNAQSEHLCCRHKSIGNYNIGRGQVPFKTTE